MPLPEGSASSRTVIAGRSIPEEAVIVSRSEPSGSIRTAISASQTSRAASQMLCRASVLLAMSLLTRETANSAPSLAFNASSERSRSLMSLAIPMKPVTVPSESRMADGGQLDRDASTVLAQVGPSPGLVLACGRLLGEDIHPGLDSELARSLSDLLEVMQDHRGLPADHLLGGVAEHPLGTGVEDGD